MRKLSVLILAVILFMGCGSVATAFADTVPSNYTTALEDLQRDKTFDASKYPSEANSIKLDVIQIAESVNSELFLYVYQPGGKSVTASSVNISQDDEAVVKNQKTWHMFKLQLLNGDGTLFKYKVLGLTLKTASKRYYDIVNIYSPAEPQKPGELGNKPNELANVVAKCFIAQTVDGNVEYHVIQTEVINVTDKLVGSLRYPDGIILDFLIGESACDSHWVAFSTDRDIDQLLEADVSFVKVEHSIVKEYHWLWGTLVGEEDNVSEGEKKEVSLHYSDTADYDGSGIVFKKKYVWNRIEAADKFVKENDLTDSAKKAFRDHDYKWVLRFYESTYMVDGPHFLKNHKMDLYTEVSEVTILRLHFRTGSRLYNLGVVDNKQQGDTVPDNNDTNTTDRIDKDISGWWEDVKKKIANFWDKFKVANIVVIGLIAIGIAAIFAKPLWVGIKKVVKFLWTVVCLPARGIVWLCRKISGKGNGE